MSETVTWVLEADIFADRHQRLRDAVAAASHETVAWRDGWIVDGNFPSLSGRIVVFHGSLGNADYVADKLNWTPGAYCRAEEFRCSRWYSRAEEWLLHRQWVETTVAELAEDPRRVLSPLGAPERFFVRPDSPLKPFSGRVLRVDEVSLQALDHGFYYEDETLPVVVAPVRGVTREWRYVVVDSAVVAGSGYTAERQPTADDPAGVPWKFASGVASLLEGPESVYVMDLCECDGELCLLELNPFSGADLYACDREKIVQAVSRRAVADAVEGSSSGG